MSADSHQDDDAARDETRVVHAGRHPDRYDGAVNPPVYHASTILSPDIADWERKKRDRIAGVPGVYYGRFGTPTVRALEEAVATLEGGAHCVVYPSGLAACAGALQAFLAAGDHALIADTVYGPTRNFANRVLKRFGVETTFYDPLVGAAVEELIRPNTRAVFVESPGSLTFEVQDVPAIASVARRAGATVIMDNTWGTPLYFKPFEHGVDVSIQAATKYIVGHSDALLGTITCTAESWPRLRAQTYDTGQTAGPDDVYLAQRGLRTLGVRLARHWENGVRLADWIVRQPEVVRVMHPALPQDPGHALWKRDFRGACGLFGVVLDERIPARAMVALLDALELFGIGASWGGYESLVMPIEPADLRTATRWPYRGPAFRVHAGLEALEDLLADFEQGFAQLRAAL
jgi:cystathionine beta-lyase